MSFYKLRQRRTVQLAPFYLGNILSGIEKELNNKIMSYSDTFNGIALSYENINVISNIANIIDDIPWINLEIECDFLVLRFIKDDIINGIVTKVNKTNIQLLVYDTFTAQIDIKNFNKKKINLDIKFGTKVSFQISSIKNYHKNQMMQIIGHFPKSSHVGYFDENQKFISIIDIITNKHKNNNNNNKNKQQPMEEEKDDTDSSDD